MACEYENENGHCTLSECMYGDFLFRDDSAFGTGYPLCMAVEEEHLPNSALPYRVRLGFSNDEVAIYELVGSRRVQSDV